jgi:hypothetical protein
VEVEALQPVTRDMVAALKLGEEHKQKSYVATCRLSAAPDPDRLAALNARTDILASCRLSGTWLLTLLCGGPVDLYCCALLRLDLTVQIGKIQGQSQGQAQVFVLPCFSWERRLCLHV